MRRRLLLWSERSDPRVLWAVMTLLLMASSSLQLCGASMSSPCSLGSGLLPGAGHGATLELYRLLGKLCACATRSAPSESAARKAAEDLSAMTSPESPSRPALHARLTPLAGFHCQLFDGCFEWLQNPDDITKESSLISRHILG